MSVPDKRTVFVVLIHASSCRNAGPSCEFPSFPDLWATSPHTHWGFLREAESWAHSTEEQRGHF